LPWSFDVSCSSRALLSFLTRRSSDLEGPGRAGRGSAVGAGGGAAHGGPNPWSARTSRAAGVVTKATKASAARGWGASATAAIGRSEEHTSELQSRENLVCRLLPEKKK